MFDAYKKKRNNIGKGLFFVFLIGITTYEMLFGISSYALAADSPGPAQAATKVAADTSRAACLKTGAIPTACPQESISDTVSSIYDGFISPAVKMIAVKGLIDLASFAANRIAYEAAMLVANGGPGQGSMFYKKSGWDAVKGFGKDIAGQAFSELSDITKASWGLDLCAPTSPLLRLNLQLSIKQNYTVQKPKCDFDKVIGNWEKTVADTSAIFGSNTFERDGYLYKKLAEGLRPGNNQLGASIGFLSIVDENAQKKAEAEWASQNNKETGANGFKNVTNFITGQVETPAQIAAKDFDARMKEATDRGKEKPTAGDILNNSNVWYGLLKMTASTFTNTLTSTLFNRVYKGLFGPKPDTSKNPFDAQLAGNAGSLSESKADLGSIFTSTPVENPQFDLLSEFAQCPPDGVGNRGLNQCVLDIDIITALNHGNMTLKEAITQKILNGDWPLISSKNVQANNDRLCYTYGYCYGNLVKMRKARLIPIGWELAADKQNISAPLSLSKVMEMFNDCNSAGQMDTDHPWCHLIDPNWVLKVPEEKCLASTNGEIRVSSQVSGRQNTCVNAQTCIGEDNSGKCTQGFGYCVEEKNIWRIKGDECSPQYATCLTLKNTKSGKEASYLLNTVDNNDCTQQNAGCAWYKTQKHLDTKGTENTKDDSFEWLPSKEGYVVAERTDDYRYQIAGSGTQARVSYGGGSTNTPAYSSYSYEDRLYLTHAAQECSQDQAGCTKLNMKSANVSLNLVKNGSFEQDKDGDGKPDGWNVLDANKLEKTKVAYAGSVSLKVSGSQYVTVTPNAFYTFSFYSSSGEINQPFAFSVALFDSNHTPVNVGGLTSSGDCEKGTVSFDGIIDNITDSSQLNNWKRYTCSFTVPSNATQVEVGFLGTSEQTIFDAVQLESGEIATDFKENGYGSSAPQATYLKVAPAYLGCQGLESDPKECDQYALVCSGADVGCNMYTPKDFGIPVPAIASAVDQCPNACVGYTSYRQEATYYEPAKPLVYFINASARSCPDQAVGCDGFTQLGANGGESQEYFTHLRACLTPDMAAASPNQSATYFTWQGSDTTGYQLETWQLLKSNTALNTLTFNGSKGVETNPSSAPCTKFKTVSNTVEQCDDDASGHMAAIMADASCEQHSDIFSNPDCREFFDKDGNIHYRRYSQTISVDAACTTYRKDVSIKTDCDASGGYWTDQGFCRYFGLQKESNVCAAAQNGCRKYVGNTGRNSTTILDEQFENGAIVDFVGGAPKLSNDSVSTGGHSMNVSTGHGVVYTKDNLLANSFVKGKVYMLNFWAKGTATIQVKINDGLGVSAQNTLDFTSKNEFKLTNNWQAYSVGPLDTSDVSFAAFGAQTKLAFSLYGGGGAQMNIDNIQLIQAQETFTVIKDSWVTPKVCDQTPDGIDSPQYYLGCRAYTDQKERQGSYYQFSHVCSEKTVGCSAYYNTFNSDSAYGQVNNVRCVKGALPNGVTVSSPTACIIQNKTYCTIPFGKSYCLFNLDQTIPDPLPKDANFAIVYGPETVVTPGDQATYLVDNGSATCSSAFAGCKEVGVPTFSQDQKSVAKFESKYIMDLPADYSKILCENRALRCDEFSTTQDGNFYFKDPLNKTCEYKGSVTINKKTLSGWFRTGTQEPCYWNDNDQDGKYDPVHDSAYLASGDQSKMWKNGDSAYDGWVGVCDSSANRCTQLTDNTDTSPENHGLGKSYYVIQNAKLTQDSIVASSKCDGRVGQKGGCALFNNATISQAKYNSSASYVLSLHADLLLNKQANDLVDPVSCKQDKGKFDISKDTAQKIGVPSATTTDLCLNRCRYLLPTNDDSINTPMAKKIGTGNLWFERSCLIDSDCPTLKTKLEQSVSAKNCEHGVLLENRVLDDSNTILKVNRDRTCAGWLACDSSHTSWDANANKYVTICDSVNRCTQSGTQGDQALCQNFSKRDPLVMTDRLYAARDTSWTGIEYSGYEIPYQLPTERLSQFNLNPKKWCVDAKTPDVPTKPIQACSGNADCGKDEICADAVKDYHLVYNAGPCKTGEASSGETCEIGFCKTSKNVCGSDEDCLGSDGKLNNNNFCVFGYCQLTTQVSCAVDTDCSGEKTAKKCNPITKTCVDHLLDVPSLSDACSTKNSAHGCATGTCVAAAATATGACYQNRCITEIRDLDGDGMTEPFNSVSSDSNQSCRGYPEIDSPFPQKVVQQWKVFDYVFPAQIKDINLDEATKSIYIPVTGNYLLDLKTERNQPSQFVAGYDASKVCEPVKGKDGFYKTNDNCLCSYKKAVYAKGSDTRYFSIDATADATTGESVPKGYCSGGPFEGKHCSKDQECSVGDGTKPGESGTCQLLTSLNAMYGWPGYCLEKDSSIQLNGSTNSKDQACLTWLPVDQLFGSTDLYGKDVGAGYQIASDTYYCAEPGVYWDFPTSDGDACAESDGECDENMTQDSANTNAYCPGGYIAIMRNCIKSGNSDLCQQGSFSDNDYPYFCVPKSSYLVQDTKDGKYKNGDKCFTFDTGANELYTHGIVDSIPDAANKTQQGVTVYYFKKSADYDKAKAYFKYCVRNGVSNEGIGSIVNLTTQYPYLLSENPKKIPSEGDPGGDDSDGYRGLSFSWNVYPACKSVVKVASAGNSGQLNAAWTNRVWTGGSSKNYCSQMGVKWDLPTSSIACAETKNGITGCTKNYTNDEANKNVYCPKNHFAVMKPCVDGGTSGMCAQGTLADNDYPYFCVPEKGLNAKQKDHVCKNPLDNGMKDVLGSYDNVDHVTSATNNVEIYYTSADSWSTAYAFYKDCVYKEVDSTKLSDEMGFADPYQMKSRDDDFGSDGYRNLSFDWKHYGKCLSTISGSYQIQNTNDSTHLGYVHSSTPSIFGQAANILEVNNEFDVKPEPILMCKNGTSWSLPLINGTCEQGKPVEKTLARIQATFNFVESESLQLGDAAYCFYQGGLEPTCYCDNTNDVRDCNTSVKAGSVAPSCKILVGSKCVNDLGVEIPGETCSGKDDAEVNANSAKCKLNKGECTKPKGTCEGDGPLTSHPCSVNTDCYKYVCGPDSQNLPHCVTKESSLNASISNYSHQNVKNSVSQIFALSQGVSKFDNKVAAPQTHINKGQQIGQYVPDAGADVKLLWNNLVSGDTGVNGKKPTPPVITSIGNCLGSSCVEGNDGAISVNNINNDDIRGDGSKHVNVTFYVHANEDQMPLRKIVVDWGDDFQNANSSSVLWPNGDQTPYADNNFYKNRRGLSQETPPKEICKTSGTDAATFGEAPEACTPGYVLFGHDYTCSASNIAALKATQRSCKPEVNSTTHSIGMSPCYESDGTGDYCVFQPRAHAADNWGWCTGFCNGGSDNSNGCFNSSILSSTPPSGLLNVNECDISKCPGTASVCTGSGGGKVMDPWVYYNGKIKIKALQ